MKRLAALLLAGALVALILHPVASVVNVPVSYDGPRADGMPAPPWPTGGSLLVADGDPAPPFPPWPKGAGSLHA